MTREDIADYLGLAFETVTRYFTRLESEGLIAIESTAWCALKIFRRWLITATKTEIETDSYQANRHLKPQHRDGCRWTQCQTNFYRQLRGLPWRRCPRYQGPGRESRHERICEANERRRVGRVYKDGPPTRFTRQHHETADACIRPLDGRRHCSGDRLHARPEVSPTRLSSADARTPHAGEYVLNCAHVKVRQRYSESGCDRRCDRARRSADQFVG